MNHKNMPSSSLSQDENRIVFSLLGPRCKTMSTAVVQLFITEPPHHAKWTKQITGVACFVRDCNRRSYFIQVYCLRANKLVWDERMHGSVVLKQERAFLITFEGASCQVALNFVSPAEANLFLKTATDVIINRWKKRQSGGQNKLHISNRPRMPTPKPKEEEFKFPNQTLKSMPNSNHRLALANSSLQTTHIYNDINVPIAPVAPPPMSLVQLPSQLVQQQPEHEGKFLDARNGLLREIQIGKSLRPVEVKECNSEPKNVPSVAGPPIMCSIKAAIFSRYARIATSDDEDDDDGHSSDWSD